MRSRTAWLALVALAACTDGTAPTHPTTQIALDFCQDQIPTLFAYLNTGSNWTRVTPAVDGTVSFNATDKVGIAMVFQSGTTSVTDMYFVKLSELQPLLNQQCTETSGTRTVNGSVASVTGSQQAVVSMSGGAAFIQPPTTAFQLIGIATGNQDLVAQRENVVGSATIPDRLILRRAQNPTSGSTMSVLDFGSTEAVQPASNTATITGLVAAETNFLDIEFSTASGTHHSLYPSPPFTSSAQTIYGVPSTLTQSGDLHHLVLEADNSAGTGYRGVMRLYRNPADQTLALGAALSTPTYTNLGSSPYARIRMTLPVQSDYSSFVTAAYEQGSGTVASRRVYVTKTANYDETPPTSTWTVDIPDITGAGGFPSGAGLVSGTNTTRIVEAFSGNLSDYIGEKPTDGATIKFGGAVSNGSAMVAGQFNTHGTHVRQTPKRPFIRAK